MKANELMIGGWVLTLKSTHKEKVYAQIWAIEEGQTSILVKKDNCNWFVDIEWIEPVSLITKILEKNGWIEASGYWVLKGHSTRLGWKDGEMIVGYSALPEKILYVHELQNLMKAVKISCNFEI